VSNCDGVCGGVRVGKGGGLGNVKVCVSEGAGG